MTGIQKQMLVGLAVAVISTAIIHRVPQVRQIVYGE